MIDFKYYANGSIDYVAKILRISTDQAQTLINKMVKNGHQDVAQAIVDRERLHIEPNKARLVLTQIYEKLIHPYRYNQTNIDEAVRYVCEDRCGVKTTQDRKFSGMLVDACIYRSYRYGDSIAHCEFDNNGEIHKAINSIIRRTPELKKQVDTYIKQKHSRGETDYRKAFDTIYRYLCQHECEAYTYNQLSVTLGIHCGTTRNVLRKLEEQGKIISFKPKNSRRMLVYKYADRGQTVRQYGANTDPKKASVKMAAVKDTIENIVKRQPGMKAKDIYNAVRNYYGKMDDKTTSRALLQLVEEHRITREVIMTRGNAKSYAHYAGIQEVDW